MTQPRKKKISLERAQKGGWRVMEQDGTAVRLGRRFEPLNPLSWEDGGVQGVNYISPLTTITFPHE